MTRTHLLVVNNLFQRKISSARSEAKAEELHGCFEFESNGISFNEGSVDGRKSRQNEAR